MGCLVLGLGVWLIALMILRTIKTSSAVDGNRSVDGIILDEKSIHIVPVTTYYPQLYVRKIMPL